MQTEIDKRGTGQRVCGVRRKGEGEKEEGFIDNQQVT